MSSSSVTDEILPTPESSGTASVTDEDYGDRFALACASENVEDRFHYALLHVEQEIVRYQSSVPDKLTPPTYADDTDQRRRRQHYNDNVTLLKAFEFIYEEPLEFAGEWMYEYLHLQAVIHYHRGEHCKSTRLLEIALEDQKIAFGPNDTSFQTGRLRYLLGNVKSAQGNLRDGLRHHLRAQFCVNKHFEEQFEAESLIRLETEHADRFGMEHLECFQAEQARRLEADRIERFGDKYARCFPVEHQRRLEAEYVNRLVGDPGKDSKADPFTCLIGGDLERLEAEHVRFFGSEHFQCVATERLRRVEEAKRQRHLQEVERLRRIQDGECCDRPGDNQDIEVKVKAEPITCSLAGLLRPTCSSPEYAKFEASHVISLRCEYKVAEHYVRERQYHLANSMFRHILKSYDNAPEREAEKALTAFAYAESSRRNDRDLDADDLMRRAARHWNRFCPTDPRTPETLRKDEIESVALYDHL